MGSLGIKFFNVYIVIRIIKVKLEIWELSFFLINFVENDEIIVIVVFEVNLLVNKINWVLDNSVLRYFCINKKLLYEFEKFVYGEYIYMGNFYYVKVLGKRKIFFKLIYDKI